MKPIIGITVDCEHDADDARTRGRLFLNWNYAQSIADAGGVPIMIPPQADMKLVSQMIHGWLIPGGDDIDASHFGEENHPNVSLQDPARFEGESRLLSQVDLQMPILGICYGCQFLNVARGGSLDQHLPDVDGRVVHTGGVMQSYPIDAGSHLAAVTDAAVIEGKSYHHQGIRRVGADLTVVSRHEDGTVEAVEASDRPWMIGVQWHPERTMDTEPSQKLFERFVQAAAKYAEGRLAATR